MKKETINTFDGGMIRDLHPLTTPNNVLTDALNATLITYNGNENILLNDIGNVEIKNALLKSGYVPVGMKEHGGIIYVAAYNPETKKGLVGSFPSPLQLWESENWSVNAPASIVNDASFNPTFYSGSFILVETIKLELFSTAEGPRIFHPGDKYIVGFPAKNNSDITSAILAGNLDIQLGVVKSDGGIEIMKTWSKDSSDNSFLYSGSSDLSTYLGNKNIVQVFDASSSGSMILILNLHTLDSFNLLRDYSLVPDTTDKIQVTFTGEGQKDGVIYHSNDGNYLRLCRTPQNSTTLSESDELQITISENNGRIQSFDIYPNIPFGVVKRMRRLFTIDFDKIRDNLDDFSEWRFFVTDKYVKIGWAYDFYNLDKTKELDYIKMYFHLLENGYSASRSGVPSVTFQRENFNGNFEDYINYNDIGLKYRNVYIVEIVKKFKDSNVELIIKFKMLYLSKLYNSQYNGFYENKSIGNSAEAELQGDIEFNRVPSASIKVGFEHELKTDLTESKTKLLRPNSPKVNNILTLETEINTADLRPGMYTTPTSAIEDLENLDSYQYLTQIKNKYGGVLKVKGHLEDLDEVYIGKPKTTLIKEILDDYSVSSIVVTTEKTWNKSTELPNAFLAMNEDLDPGTRWDSGENNGTRLVTLPTNPTKTVSNDGILTTGIFEFDDYRILQGRVSGIQSVTYNSKGLKPLYAPEYTGEKKRKIAPYYDLDSCLCIAGAGESENGTFYNTSVMRNGDIREGPDSGGGFDDGGLSTSSNYMGNPMTNIFTGTRGEEAELVFEDTSRNYNGSPASTNDNNPWVGWGFLHEGSERSGPYLDEQGENFMVACWRFTDGDTHLVNLMSPRIPRHPHHLPSGYVNSKENYIKSTTKWPRLDVVMKCLLSLIFVVNRITKKSEYVTTDDKFYRFQEGKTTIKITLSNSNHSYNDIMVSDNNDSNTSLLTYLTGSGWNFSNDSITIGSTTYPMKNLIPQVDASCEDIELTLEIPNYYDMDALSTYYFGSEYKYLDPDVDSLDVQAIYKLDIRSETLADNAAACRQSTNGRPVANIDGPYEWIGTPRCVPLTSTNKTLDIYRWDDASKIEFSNFYDHFKSKAKMEEWTDIPEDAENEVFALGSSSTCGWWTNADDEHAPDLYYNVLFSPLISPLTYDYA